MIWFTFILGSAVSYVISVFFSDLKDEYYAHGAKNVHVRFTIVLVKAIAYVGVYPFLSDIFVLQFCILCWRCCRSIRCLRVEVEKSTVREFDVPAQMKIVSSELKIMAILEDLQKVFSLPSFLMFATHYCACSSLLGWLVLGELRSAIKTFQTAFYFGSSFACLVAYLWVPGKLPVEMNKLKEAFRQKSRLRWIFLGSHQEEDVFEKAFCGKEPLVITGFNIVSFRQSSILAVIGTILSYTLLLVH
ncbi:hypothetical protein JTE90_026733 [Oedothorax gibbosus]|uniref:Gustatory receptor n=1 Tax=Oedothorax gibbosus TaxID=931172 RepID=A0AAV6U5A0_9ARAC|nr:hypothetical protein JTE90_026733 [Oedothorax gibbosus]